MPNNRSESGITRLAAFLSLAVAFSVGPTALAQSMRHAGPNSIGRTLLNRQNGGYRTGLSGVKAQLPRPIANRGSLLPPPPSFHSPGPGGPHGPSGPGPGMRPGGGFGRGDMGRPRAPIGGDHIDARIDSGSGIRVSGSVTDDNFRLRFDLNPGGVGRGGYYGHHDGDHHGQYHSQYSPAYRYWPYADLWGLGWWGSLYRNDYYEPQLVVSQPVYVDPSLAGTQTPAAQQPSTPMTAMQKGDLALYEGRVDDAIKAYREHLEQTPEDADTMRLLAISLVQDKKVKEAVALIALAYEKDISLVRKPMDPRMVADGDAGFREVLLSTVTFANKMKSASGYLAVVVMMQAEGREAQALKVLKKARLVGLDEKLAIELETELGR